MLRCCPTSVSIPAENEDYRLIINYMQASDIFSGLKLRHLAFERLFSIIEAHNIHIENIFLSPCVEKAVEYINKNLSAQLSVSEIAENTFVSKSTLTKHFKKELKMSVHTYIYDTIMFEAGLLLSKNEMSVLSVSEKFGFSDQFYFSRCFKEKFGVLPRDYKKITII